MFKEHLKTKKWLVLLLVAVMLMTTVLAGCGNDQATNDQEGNEGQEAGNEADETSIDSEQYINTLLGAEPRTLDPSKATDLYSSQIDAEILEGLTRIEQDENGNDVIRPAAAERWETSDDGLVWTFYLRDLNWEDGKPVTAHDFEYSIKRTLNPDTGSSYAYLLSPIKGADEYNAGKIEADEVGVKALDDKTLQFTLESPCAYFLQLTYFKTMLPQRQDIVEKYGDSYGTEAEKMLACGPFKIESWTHNNEVVLVKNDTYWDKDSVILEKINMKIINDQNARYNALLSGAIDMAGVSKPEWIQKFEETGKFNRIQGYDPSCNYMFYNHNDKLFSNANVRKAFTLAITREDMANVIFHGIFEAAYGWVPPSLQLDGKDFRELVGEEPIRKLAEENPDPKELLKKGLEELGMDPDPSKVTVTMLQSGTDQWYRTYAEYMQQMFKKQLGINMEAEYVEWPVFQKRTDELDYQIAGMAWNGDYNDPMTFFDMWKSDAGIVPTGWVNEEYDSIIEEAQNTNDSEKRLELFKKAENILLYDEAVFSPTVYRRRNSFRYKYVKGVMSPLFGETEYKYAYTQGRP